MAHIKVLHNVPTTVCRVQLNKSNTHDKQCNLFRLSRRQLSAAHQTQFQKFFWMAHIKVLHNVPTTVCRVQLNKSNTHDKQCNLFRLSRRQLSAAHQTQFQKFFWMAHIKVLHNVPTTVCRVQLNKSNTHDKQCNLFRLSRRQLSAAHQTQFQKFFWMAHIKVLHNVPTTVCRVQLNKSNIHDKQCNLFRLSRRQLSAAHQTQFQKFFWMAHIKVLHNVPTTVCRVQLNKSNTHDKQCNLFRLSRRQLSAAHQTQFQKFFWMAHIKVLHNVPTTVCRVQLNKSNTHDKQCNLFRLSRRQLSAAHQTQFQKFFWMAHIKVLHNVPTTVCRVQLNKSNIHDKQCNLFRLSRRQLSAAHQTQFQKFFWMAHTC